jgi:S-adenosylmethionine-diacylglycerol 3-amino-3-carboxypropyl transferase
VIRNGERGLTIYVDALRRNRLQQAVCQSPPVSRLGFLEKLFAWVFKGLVYPQIWEDPEVDMEALAITPQCHVVAIASGGCNILSYLVANPGRITAVDLNKAHVALSKLKLAASVHLPSWSTFFQFFGEADEKANLKAYWRFLAPHLDAETRAYWETRTAFGIGARRISFFSHNVYRHGLLGRFIGFGHALARAYGVDLSDLLQARSLNEQRSFFRNTIAPLFDKRFVRWALARPWSLYGLGIPPAQYAALAPAGGDDMATVLRGRIEKLVCDFGLQENYFAWQAFGRCYSENARGSLPPYLQQAHFDAVRSRAHRAEVLNCNLAEYLESRPDKSLDRYVLLDAQDWMTNAQLNTLWKEITRTARPGARVIFRTAAEPNLLPGRVDDTALSRWRYEADMSRNLTARDRSAIYGGFHLYVFEG